MTPFRAKAGDTKEQVQNVLKRAWDLEELTVSVYKSVQSIMNYLCDLGKLFNFSEPLCLCVENNTYFAELF